VVDLEDAIMDRPHSYSSLSTLANCAQLFDYKYREELEAPDTRLPMLAGSAIDAALNVLYTKAWDFSEAATALAESWGDTRTPLGSKHPWLTLPFLEERLRLYMQEREESPTILEEGEVLKEWSGVKKTFEWVGDSGVVSVTSIPDFVLLHGGKHYIPDLKCTTQWINDYWFMQFRISHQLRIYAAQMQSLEGIRVDGGLINAVYMGEKALDPPEAWKKRKSAPSALKLVDFTQEQIADAHWWVTGLEAQERAHEESGIWPKNEKACNNYGGCEFLPLCTAPSENVRRALMMTQFRRKNDETKR
jgi:hypothetical protein